jgi:hypothetical protein
VVIGKVGFGNRRGDAINMASFLAVDAGGKAWQVSLQPELAGDGGQSAPFFAGLPPGEYQLTQLELMFSESSWTMEDMGMQMRVQPGRLSCAGAAYARAGITGEDSDGSRYGAMFEVRDECPALHALLRQQSPFLAEPPVVDLMRPREVSAPKP